MEIEHRKPSYVSLDGDSMQKETRLKVMSGLSGKIGIESRHIPINRHKTVTLSENKN